MRSYDDVLDDIDADDEPEFDPPRPARRTSGGWLRIREKFGLALGILLLGTLAAMVARRSSAPQQSPAGAPPPAEKPAVWEPLAQPLQSHLLGRIEPLAGAAPAGPGDEAPPPGDPWAGQSPLDRPPPTPEMGQLQAAAPARLVPVDGSYQPADEPPTSEVYDYRLHIVADGDTLSSLAGRYLGAHARYQEIFELNRGVLRDPNVLPIGAQLRIPSRRAAAAADQRAPAAAGQPRLLTHAAAQSAPLVPVD